MPYATPKKRKSMGIAFPKRRYGFPTGRKRKKGPKKPQHTITLEEWRAREAKKDAAREAKKARAARKEES